MGGSGQGPIAPSGPARAPIASSGPDRALIAPSGPDQGAIAVSLLALLYKVTRRHPQQNRRRGGLRGGFREDSGRVWCCWGYRLSLFLLVAGLFSMRVKGKAQILDNRFWRIHELETQPFFLKGDLTHHTDVPSLFGGLEHAKETNNLELALCLVASLDGLPDLPQNIEGTLVAFPVAS